MHDALDLLHFLHLHYAFNDFFYCDHPWHFHHTLDYLFHYLLDFYYFGSYTEHLQNVIHTHCFHYFSPNHAQHTLIHLQDQSSFCFQLLQLLQ
jgi:hypothetical protein